MTFNEEPEPTESEMEQWEHEQAVKSAQTVRIEGITVEAVQIVIGEAIGRIGLQEMARERFDKAIEDAVTGTFSERLTALTDEAIRPLIDKYIADGFPTFDQWGKITGKKPFVQVLHETLTKTSSYNSETLVHQIFKERLNAALSGEFGKALEDAKKRVRAMLDDEVSGRFTKALKEGFGLK